MSLWVSVLCFIFVALIGIWVGAQLDQAYGPNNVLPDCGGTVLIYTQDGEAYLFLDTELTPDELSKKSEVIFKVETRNMQAPL